VSRPEIWLSFNDNIDGTVLTDLASSSSAGMEMSTIHHSRDLTLCDLPALSFSTSVRSWSLCSGSEAASSGHCEFEEFMLWRGYASSGGRVLVVRRRVGRTRKAGRWVCHRLHAAKCSGPLVILLQQSRPMKPYFQE
jgi:hypothetical protein